MHLRLLIAVTVAASVGGAPLSWSNPPPSQANTPNGDALVSACAGNDFSSTGQVGDSISGGSSFSVGSPANLSDQQTCVARTGSLANPVTTGTVSDSATWGGPPSAAPVSTYSGQSKAVVTMGQVHVDAVMTGAANTNFAGAAAQGGFNNMVTPMGGGPIGTKGIWTFSINVTGDLLTSGTDAAALAEVEVYENTNELTPSGGSATTAFNTYTAKNSAFDPFTHHTQVGQGDFNESFDYEMVPFEANSNTSGDGPISLTVNGKAWFSLPVTWGTPIELGIYGLAQASEDASAIDTSPNGAQALFLDTFAYGGPGYAYDVDSSGNIVGGPITDFTLLSDGPVNYNISYAPEPTGLSLLGVALLGMGLVRRGRAARG